MPPDYQDSPRRVSFVRLGLVILVLAGLGALIWAIFFHTTPTNQGSVASGSSSSQSSTPSQAPKPPQTSSSQQKPNSSSGSGSYNTNASQGSTANQPTAPTTTPSPAPTPTATPTNPKQLSNAGPGNTVALFAGVTAVTALAHFLITRRQTNPK